MGKLTEMEAKLRKGPSMLGHAKFHERLQDHVIELATSVDALTAERDRLAAEISATNAAYATLLESHELILDALTESDATLDRLRAVGEDWIRGGESLEGSYEAMTRMYAIINPENET